MCHAHPQAIDKVEGAAKGALVAKQEQFQYVQDYVLNANPEDVPPEDQLADVTSYQLRTYRAD